MADRKKSMLVYHLYIDKIYESVVKGPGTPSLQDLAVQHARLILALLPAYTELIDVDRPHDANDKVPFTVTYWHPVFCRNEYIEVFRQPIAWMENNFPIQRGSIISIKYFKRNGIQTYLH